jgi:unsaturated rhamnogalacturonyl hydrolase
MDDSVRLAAEYAAERSLDHDWNSLGEFGIALNGLLAVDDGTFTETIEDLVDLAIRTQTSSGQLCHDFVGSGSWDDVVTAWSGTGGFTSNIGAPLVGQAVLDVLDRTGDTRYRRAVRRQYEAVEAIDRTADGGIPTRRERPELWIDAIFMVAPFLARFGRLVGERAPFDEAVRQIRVHADHLEADRHGVFRHIWCEQPDTYPDGALWARGNGWMLAGMADTLAYLPGDHEDRDWLETRFVDLSAAIRSFRDDSGLWRNVLDDPMASLEVSAACQFAYAYQRGVDAGLLDEDYERLATESLATAAGFVATDGEVKRVALTPGGPGAPIGGGGHGQGWFLLAAGTVGS